MNRKEIKFGQYKVVVQAATVSIGMYRSILINNAVQEEDAIAPVEGNLQYLARRILHTMIYPTLIAGTVEAEGFEHWPITFAEFAELPEEMEPLWENAVFELNPHWKAKVDPDPTTTDGGKKSRKSG
jgi:hypothetical protein